MIQILIINYIINTLAGQNIIVDSVGGPSRFIFPPPPHLSFYGSVDIADQWMPSIYINPSSVGFEHFTQKGNATNIRLSQAYFVNAPVVTI